jgi:hypothetical protein
MTRLSYTSRLIALASILYLDASGKPVCVWTFR